MKTIRKEMKCAFVDDFLSEEGERALKELILRGYHPLPLASEGILVLGKEMKKLKGGDRKNVFI